MKMIVLCPGEMYNGRYYNPLDKFYKWRSRSKKF